MNNSRALDMTKLNGIQPVLVMLITPVLFPYGHGKMFAEKAL